jgi:hypothetical protein
VRGVGGGAEFAALDNWNTERAAKYHGAAHVLCSPIQMSRSAFYIIVIALGEF